jgi:hypothetical protein
LLLIFDVLWAKVKAEVITRTMHHDETIVVSPVALRCAAESVSPTADFATPRTSLKAMRRQSRARPEGPSKWLDESPVLVVPTAALTPAGKVFPDGLIRTPSVSPPSAWATDDATEPRRLGATSMPRSDDDFFITQHVCELMLASPPTKLANGHVTFATANDDASMLKQRQMHRMQKLQFDHPALNTTPQRLAGTSKGLREILNSNATTVLFMPKPPPKVS